MNVTTANSTTGAVSDRGRHFGSFRDYVEALRGIGEIQEIDQPVDWNLEMGAIIRHIHRDEGRGSVVQQCDRSRSGFACMGAPAATSRQPGHYLARLAMMMGHDPRATGLELVEAYVEAKSRPVLAPILVARDKAPCKQNVMLGEDVDLTRFPVPYIHDGDGGRYIQTAGVNIVRSPDGTWTNWSVNRSMIVDKNHLTGLVIPDQHIGIVHGMWKQAGKPTPWALALGAPPAAMLAAGAPMPAYVNEPDYVSQLTGEPVELVKCETVDLEVPASAEIVIEGHIRPRDRPWRAHSESTAATRTGPSRSLGRSSR